MPCDNKLVLTKVCERFPATAGGKASFGLEIVQDSVAGTICVSHPKYAEKLVKLRVQAVQDVVHTLRMKWTAFMAEFMAGKPIATGLDDRVALGSIVWPVRTH